MRNSFAGACLITLFLSKSLVADSLSLSLPDDGAFSVSPGGTVGLGFMLDYTDDPNGYFAVITSSSFCTGPLVSPCALPDGFSYSDIIGNNFVVLGPNPEQSTISEEYDMDAGTGLGSISADSGVSAGTVLSGTVYLTYDVYDGDPNSGGDYASSSIVSAPATVTVAASSPEPSSFIMFGTFACAGILVRSRRTP